MIINCGKRRLVSYRYGWRIEIEAVNKETGKPYWTEDRPAYPANLANGLEMLCERELTDGPDIPLSMLHERLKQAAAQVRHYMELARKAA